MAITLADFNKIWASTSPLTPYSFSEANYKQGWNFVGSTPPARQMWDFIQKNNDEKMQYLANNYLPLSGGIMTGAITLSNGKGKLAGYSTSSIFSGDVAASNNTRIILATNASGGGFGIDAGDGTTKTTLNATPSGTLTWGGQNVLTASNYNSYALPLSGGTLTGNNAKITMSNGESYIVSYGNGIYIGGTEGSNATSMALFTNTNGNGFQLNAGDGTTQKRMVGKPDGTLTWDGKSIPERSYGLNLVSTAGQNTYTFNIVENSAVIFAKRGSNCSCHMVDIWTSDSVKIFSTATDPITVTKSADSSSVTITNVNGNAIAIKILNGGAL